MKSRFFVGITIPVLVFSMLMSTSVSYADTLAATSTNVGTTTTVVGTSTITSSTIVSTSTASIIPVNISVSDCFVVSRNLGMSMRDRGTQGSVSMLQKFLLTEDYLGIQPTGYFGPITFAAVKQFQKNNHIVQTGFVGPLTLAAIKNISCGNDSGSNGNGGQTGAPITITSPQADTTWVKGQSNNIVWSSFQPETFAAGPIPPNQASYDIFLVPFIKPCTNKICPMYMMMIKPYTIATSIPSNGSYHMSYRWIVGVSAEADRTIPVGDYRIQICTVGGTACSETEKFTITQ